MALVGGCPTPSAVISLRASEEQPIALTASGVAPLLACRLAALEHLEDVAAALEADEVPSVLALVGVALVVVREIERVAVAHPDLNIAESLTEVAVAGSAFAVGVGPGDNAPSLPNLGLGGCCAEQ